MRKIILIAHTLLDGFVAGEKGELDHFNPGSDNLQFVCSLTEYADAFLAGRRTYELLDSFWPSARDRPDATPDEIRYSNWYNAAEKIVISGTLEKKTDVHNTIISKNISRELISLKKTAGKNILMFGSPSTFQSIAGMNLIDEYWLIIYPIIFGKGIPLFSSENHRINLNLLSIQQLANGEIALNYRVQQ